VWSEGKMCDMRLIDSLKRLALLETGSAVEWLRDELRMRGVSVPMTEACLRAFVNDADATARQVSGNSYESTLKQQIAARAEFLKAWTGSDEPIDASDVARKQLVSIARQYALPRRWKLSEPEVVRSPRRIPHHFHWARAT
jgi:hypothetical protein